MDLYRLILRPAFFRLDPERAHNLALQFLALTPAPLLRLLFPPPPAGEKRSTLGLTFPNPVGLAAGLDKNAEALSAWEALGFGFIEIGTITALPQPGNPKPRAFRYPAQQALVNRMGFNNLGAEAIAARLGQIKKSGRWPRVPVGINLGKSKVTPLDQAPGDYLISLRALLPFGDYFVVNVSSPNTPGLRDLQNVTLLRGILTALRPATCGKPLLMKIAPDLADEDALAIAGLAEAVGLDGLIATNTTLDHSALPASQDQSGGLSGAPLRQRATSLTRLLTTATRLPVIASGGIMSTQDAAEKLRADASLVQIFTGFIYHGPGLIRSIASLPRDPNASPLISSHPDARAPVEGL